MGSKLGTGAGPGQEDFSDKGELTTETSFEVPGAGRISEPSARMPERETPDVFVVAGAIKWFDVSKGFGFVVPDDDLPDVLLHVPACATMAIRLPMKVRVSFAKWSASPAACIDQRAHPFGCGSPRHAD